MQEKVEKYIYFVSENRYRIKFLKVSKKENIKIILFIRCGSFPVGRPGPDKNIHRRTYNYAKIK